MTNSPNQKFRLQCEPNTKIKSIWSDIFACDSINIYISDFFFISSMATHVEMTIPYIYSRRLFSTSCGKIQKSLAITLNGIQFVSFRFDPIRLQLKILINFKMSKLYWTVFTFPFFCCWIQCVWLMITSSNSTQVQYTTHTPLHESVNTTLTHTVARTTSDDKTHVTTEENI